MTDDHDATSREQPRALVGDAGSTASQKAIDHIDFICARFIAASPFVMLATRGADGLLDLSPKGDPAGFVGVLDETTLAGRRDAPRFALLIAVREAFLHGAKSMLPSGLSDPGEMAGRLGRPDAPGGDDGPWRAGREAPSLRGRRTARDRRRRRAEPALLRAASGDER